MLYLFIDSLQIQAEKGLPTAEEAYNFFTFNFEPDPQEVTESRKSKKQKETAEGDRDEEGGEEVEEQGDAELDEDNQDQNEDQVRHQQYKK